MFSFFGIDLFCTLRKYLVYNLVARNLKIKYRYSIFGFLWTLLIPLSQTLVYYTVFNVIMKIQVPNYLLLILSGVLPWAFFSQTILEGLDSIVGNSPILTKVPVPLQVFPLSGAITNLITLVLSTPVIIGIVLWSGLPLGWPLLFLPFFWACLFLLAYGFAVTLGLLFVYLRDLKHVFGILIQLWFYATPVLYHESMIPENYRWLLSFNPVGDIFVGIHQICFESQWPGAEQIWIPMAWAGFSVLLSLASLKILTGRAVESL